MPRSGSTAMLAALQAGELRPAIFLEATFRTGPIYVWTGYGPITWNGHTWQGVGTMGSVSAIEEGASVQAKGITISLSGFDPALLNDVLTEFKVGEPVMVWLGCFDASGVIIDAPILSWAGRMDQPTVDVIAQLATISINCESRLINMNVAPIRRYTNEDQQLDHPGDRGFEFVTGLVERNVNWGRTPSSSNNL